MPPKLPEEPSLVEAAPPALPADLTLEALKRLLGKQLEGDDEQLEELLKRAFAQAQAPSPYGCGRLLSPNPPLDREGRDTAEPVTLKMRMRGRRIAIPDARELTSVVLDGVRLVEDTDYHVLTQDDLIVLLELPRDHPLWREWWWRRRHAQGRHRTLELTGRFGALGLPDNLRGAILQLAARYWHERDAAFADQVMLADGTGVQAYYRQLPPAVRLAFASYEVPMGTAGLA